MKYDYYKAVKEDIKNYISENYTHEEIAEKLLDKDEWHEVLNDELWVTDSVSGNASGSYTFNNWTAKEYVICNIDILSEAIQEFCVDSETVREKFLNEEWEYFDVTIRCYVLSGSLWEVLDELEVTQ